MRKVKLGIVGLRRGSVHIGFIQNCKYIDLVAICDIDKDTADDCSQKYGISNVYYDYRDLLENKEIEAVLLATPIDAHEAMVCLALHSGKHVLSEVIVADTLQGIDHIAETIKTSGKKYMMAENYCYIRPLLIVEEMVKRGMFGEIYYAESDYLKDFQEYHPKFPEVGGWRQKTYFGRKGHPYITHSIGPLLHIMKEKVTTVCAMGSGNNFDMIADNTCTLMLKTENSHLVRLRSSFVSPRPDNVTYYSFQGTEGCYQAPQSETDFHKVYIKGICRQGEWKNVYEFMDLCSAEWSEFWNREDYCEHTLDNDTYQLYDSGTAMMLDQFARCIINNTEPPISFSDSANWTAAGLISADSVTGNSVPLDIPL